ncbi:putative ABC transport system permease protein [Saccharothrix tamanrassetensis]|uniref:Putative ABC transport system permease protein n=1 Tax=Saccharothrix tamanrassetensis TaxID=1051531 RepID=A0A841CPC4_9PSEU|nr:FtsX-like permease family protein [Saccharothrix tamanrassetensis]MBB5959511.1 putative ABC transport system permease protein [Saccharothrix tamanrassetensis]
MIRLSGRLRSSLIIGGQGIRARKLRTFLSMVSLFMGVLAVVVVQAGAEIANRALLADVELSQGKDGTRQMYLNPEGKTVETALDVLAGRTDAVAMTTVQAIIGEPGVKPVNEGGGPVDQPGGYGRNMTCDVNGCYEVPTGNEGAPSGQAVELQLVGLTGDIRSFRPFRVDSGQWLDFGGDPSLAPRLVLNTKAAEAFRRFEVPAEMRLQGSTINATPRFVGVVEDGGYAPAAYVRSDELLNWLGAGDLSSGRNGPGLQVMMSPAASEVEHALRARLVAAGTPEEQIHVNTVNTLERMSTELSLMRWIFLGMAALVLLIGVAGILNVGLATVGERIEEFALRRAVGTPRLLLAGIVLAETLLTGLLTAAAAIGVGVVALQLASGMFGSRYPSLQGIEFPWQAGVAGVVAGLVAGVLGGLVPAVRAARIPIATVMRA